MIATLLLPDSRKLQINGDITIENNQIHLNVAANPAEICCPDCRSPSIRVHSRYWRTLLDLPCAERSVYIHWQVRRFFCDDPLCPRTLFAEQIPEHIDRYARKTQRLQEKQRQIAFQLGGESGKRVAVLFHVPISGDQLLRLVGNSEEVQATTPRVLGIDDWALCKGHSYGTILVDLETHQVIDLLPDRKSETVTKWLQEHPGVEIISRDRGQEYIDGISNAGSCAVEIADRFHLLKNLLEVLQRMFEHRPADLQLAQKKIQSQEPQQQPEEPEGMHPTTPVDDNRKSKPTSVRQSKFDSVKEKQQQGISQREIARQVGLDRRTVSKYFHLDEPPQKIPDIPSSSKALPYMAFIRKRWEEGQHNLTHLWGELQQQGFPGSYACLHRAVHRLPGVPDLRSGAKKASKPARISPRQAAWSLLRLETELQEKQKVIQKALCESSAAAYLAYRLAQDFRIIFKEMHSEKLDDWLQQAEESGISEFKNFASGLRKDYGAVKAALQYSWSNGQTEGQVNRLKLIKRQMYGRASFGLLKKRVLGPAPIS